MVDESSMTFTKFNCAASFCFCRHIQLALLRKTWRFLIISFISILLSLTIALLSDLLWRAEARAGKILLTAITMVALIVAIGIAQVGSSEQADPLVPWIAILSATLLLKWLHTIFRETDGK